MSSLLLRRAKLFVVLIAIYIIFAQFYIDENYQMAQQGMPGNNPF